MSPKILVGYITRAGYTRTVAEAIARRLHEHDLETDVVDLELSLRQPRKYHAVILGSAVRFGHHPTAMHEFITMNRAALMDRPTAFFSVERKPATDEAMQALFRQTEWQPLRTLAVRGVQGALLRRTVAWVQDRLDATSVTHVAAPTEWARIDAFADEVAELVRARTERQRPLDRAMQSP